MQCWDRKRERERETAVADHFLCRNGTYFEKSRNAYQNNDPFEILCKLSANNSGSNKNPLNSLEWKEKW